MKKQKLHFTPDLLTGRLTEEDTKKYFSRFGWFAFAVFLICSVIQTVIANVVYFVAPDIYYNHIFLNLLSMIPLYCMAVPLAYLILRHLPKVVPIKGKMKAKDMFFCVCICLSLMMVGNYISQIIMTFFQTLRGEVIENPLESALNNTPIWSVILFTVILAPILEELFFRGIVCKRLLALGEGYAIVIPAAFFALFHGNFYQLFYAFTLGCFFSFIYVKTGKLRYTVFLHMLINFIGGAIPTIFFTNLDLNAMMEGNLEYITANMIPIFVLLIYELINFGGAIAGVIIIATQFRKFKLQSGILPPPEKKGASCALLNVGTAVAIALFTLNLLSSLLI